jgi:heme oxygenase
MSNLKELTWEHHKNAERQEFVKVLMSGDIDKELYARYLYNQFPCYELLEVMSSRFQLFNTFPEALRCKKILADYLELWPADKEPPEVCESTKKYIMHMKEIMDDPNKLMAHVYVRHMGDLSGGQMISKKVPGEGRYYKFDGDIKDIKERIREKIDDSMAEEAKICFDYATELFKDMMQYVK